MRKRVNIGDKFGHLTIIKESDPFLQPSGQKARAFLCGCVCGVEKKIRLSHLSSGKIASCGCVNRVRNGESNSSLFKRWKAMISRCYDRSNNKYHIYGGRGIIVCGEWRNNYNSFKDWAIKSGFRENLQIDRIDNNSGYSPDNCRIVTPSDNCNNRNITTLVTIDGITMPIMKAFPIMGISDRNMAAIRGRISRGWDHSEAFRTPIRTGNYKNGKKEKVGKG